MWYTWLLSCSILNFSFSKTPIPDLGPPSLLFNGYRAPLLRLKLPEREVKHSRPPRSEVKNECIYRDADKSLARPGRKKARKHVRDARDFNNIETRALIKFFFLPARQDAEGNSRHSDRNISLFPSCLG